jgi:hypothetical protein
MFAPCSQQAVAAIGAPALLCRAMFVSFFHELKAAGVPVTLREYLTLMEAMERDLAGRRVEDFYYLSRATLIKDERNLDKFDRVSDGLECRQRSYLASELSASSEIAYHPSPSGARPGNAGYMVVGSPP